MFLKMSLAFFKRLEKGIKPKNGVICTWCAYFTQNANEKIYNFQWKYGLLVYGEYWYYVYQ